MSVSGAAASPAVGDTTQLTATASLSDGSSRAVTSDAAWDSTNTAVATVTPAGLASFIGAGDAELRATFSGRSGTARVTVAPRAAARFQLSGVITEAGTSNRLTDATVAVADGPDAGRSTVTDGTGTYTLANVREGSFNLRITRNGFEPRTVPVSLTADARLDVVMTSTVDVTGLLGTYNTTLGIAQQSCEFTFTVGPTGTIKLEARTDGSNLLVTVVERGTTRTYNGTIRTDGSFSGNGGGVIAGLTTGRDRHDYTGDIAGQVSGRSISATENVLFGTPCPGKTMRITYTGSR